MKHILSLSVAALVSLASVSMAHAEWKRNSTVTGPNGGVIVGEGSGSCSGGACSSTQTWTGPKGGQTVRNGQTVCYQGVCKRSATLTTPRGKVYQRNSTVTRY